MQIIRNFHNLPKQFENGCVATIGNYDGVHLGHQQILTRLREKSAELRLPSVVIILMPQPDDIFTREKPWFLTSLRERIFLFSQYGIDGVVVLIFSSCFANISAPDFVEKILLANLQVRFLVIGDDFAFGHKRQGNFAFLGRYAGSFRVEQVPTVKIDGVRVSSTLIRLALLQNDLETAARFLGRAYQVNGRVVHGNNLGKDLGFPTANIYLTQRKLLLRGVFAVKIHGIAKEQLYGVANMGLRPTFGGQHEMLEVYIFNFAKNIYGKRITVEFYQKIRAEKKFPTVKELQLQIAKDLLQAKEMFKLP